MSHRTDYTGVFVGRHLLGFFGVNLFCIASPIPISEGLDANDEISVMIFWFEISRYIVS